MTNDNNRMRGDLYLHETNDCVVLAFTVAAQISYATAHQLCKKHGRIDGRGTYDHTVHKVAIELGATPIDLINGRNIIGLRRDDWPTVQQFVLTHPAGRYFIIRGGHAFAIVDGAVHDWASGTGALSRVYMCYHFA
jgi:hypothetical protein